jgi:hypothetical protein
MRRQPRLAGLLQDLIKKPAVSTSCAQTAGITLWITLGRIDAGHERRGL